MPQIELGSQQVTVPMTAGEAISDGELVYASGDDTVALATGTETQQCIGVADENAQSGDTFQVVILGKKDVTVDGAVSVGEPVVPAATAGRAVSEVNAPASHTHTMPTHSHTVPNHTHTMPTHSHTALSTSGTDATPGAHQPMADGAGSGTNLLAGVSTAGQAADTVNTDSVDPGDTNAGGPGSTDAADPGDTNSADASPQNARAVGMFVTSASAAGDTATIIVGAKSG